MHPFIEFTDEHEITTYRDFIEHEELLRYPKFQSMMPSYLLWSNDLDGQLQRAFAASVPMATVLDTRYVDGPDEPVTPKGWLTRKSGNCEYTGLTTMLKDSWGIEGKEELLARIDELSTQTDEHVLLYDVFRKDLAAIVALPRAERADAVEKRAPAAVERGQLAGIPEADGKQWWDTFTAPFLEDSADLTLPPAADLPISLIAWNIRRMSVLAWTATRTGLVEVADVEQYLRTAISTAQERYEDWGQFHDAFHLARRYHLGSTEENYDDQIAGAWMLRHGHSPWRILPLRGNGD